jgi:hypothetical protein
VVVCALAALASLGPGSAGLAQARPAVRILSLGVVHADGRTPARPPYRRVARYNYRVVYRISGDVFLRVTRAATLLAPGGRPVAAVRPAARVYDPGGYVASAPIRVGPANRPGTYVLRYTIVVRDRDGALMRREKRLPITFR